MFFLHVFSRSSVLSLFSLMHCSCFFNKAHLPFFLVKLLFFLLFPPRFLTIFFSTSFFHLLHLVLVLLSPVYPSVTRILPPSFSITIIFPPSHTFFSHSNTSLLSLPCLSSPPLPPPPHSTFITYYFLICLSCMLPVFVDLCIRESHKYPVFCT